MNQRRVWLLALAAGLFAVWIAYLAYLALLTGGQASIVLSRPQFLVADVWAIADVKDLQSPIKITDVVKGPDSLKDAEIKVSNLSDCQEYWKGSGSYIVPLSGSEKAGFLVAPLPRDASNPAPRIYPVTTETRAQLDKMPKP
jgi:hypothetical protein